MTTNTPTFNPTPREELLQHLAWQITSCRKALKEWTVKLEAYPVDAFKWADNAMLASARLQLAEELRSNLAAETCTLERVREELQRRVALTSRYAHNGSTSACSNHIDRCVLSATAEALETLQQYIKA